MKKNRYEVTKFVLFFFLLLGIYYIQTGSYSPQIGGYHLDLFPAFLCSVAVVAGPLYGAVFGIIVGVLYDLSMLNIEGLYSCFYMLYGVWVSILINRYFKATLTGSVLFTAAAMLFVGTVKYVFYFYLIHRTNFLYYIQIICAEILLTLAFLPLIFIITKWIGRSMDRLGGDKLSE